MAGSLKFWFKLKFFGLLLIFFSAEIAIGGFILGLAPKHQKPVSTPEVNRLAMAVEIPAVSETSTLTITATCFPLYDLVQRLAPEEKISLLIPPGADFHHFEPRFRDFRILHQSDLVVAVGTEPWLKVQSLKKVLFLTKAKNVENPHLWLNLPLLEEFVDRLTQTLTELRPSRAQIFQKRAQEIKRKIKSIRKELRALRKCPRKKVIILGHEALEYFLKEADLEEIALAGPHPESEVQPPRLRTVLEILQKEKIKTVYLLDPPFQKYLPLFDKEGVQILKLNPGLPLFPEDRKLDFFALLRQNIRNLEAGLCISNLPNF